jgi:hypothetical protein
VATESRLPEDLPYSLVPEHILGQLVVLSCPLKNVAFGMQTTVIVLRLSGTKEERTALNGSQSIDLG